MKKKLTIWLAVGFTLAFLGNILFVVNILERTRVVAVPDGDSLDLADGRRIRLLGIDAPEKGRCMAGEARAKLVERAQGRHVRLKHTVTDDYGRQLAIVIIEDLPTWLGYMRYRFFPPLASKIIETLPISLRSGVNWHDFSADGLFDDPLLQRGLLLAGLARNRSGTDNPYHQVLVDAQQAAKSARLGIWSDACRGQTSGEQDCTIKGNTRAGKKSYYTPDCPTYDQVIVDTAFGDAWYCSEKEAQGAGFTLASSCN